MMNTLNNFLKLTAGGEGMLTITRPWIVCKDGFTLSVQASVGHYCQPRLTLPKLKQNIYTHFEVMCSAHGVVSLNEFYLGDGSIYGEVPKKIVQEVIDSHGGIDITKSMVAYIKSNQQ